MDLYTFRDVLARRYRVVYDWRGGPDPPRWCDGDRDGRHFARRYRAFAARLLRAREAYGMERGLLDHVREQMERRGHLKPGGGPIVRCACGCGAWRRYREATVRTFDEYRVVDYTAFVGADYRGRLVRWARRGDAWRVA